MKIVQSVSAFWLLSVAFVGAFTPDIDFSSRTAVAAEGNTANERELMLVGVQVPRTPSEAPTDSPAPSPSPSKEPTGMPTGTEKPTPEPSVTPTASPVPSPSPSATPTSAPSSTPTDRPSATPSVSPTDVPSTSPSQVPTNVPSTTPSQVPTTAPSVSPAPSSTPSATPTAAPSLSPSATPSATPSVSSAPSTAPSSAPSTAPTAAPSSAPTPAPSLSSAPSHVPSISPSDVPSTVPSTSFPSTHPSQAPSVSPSTFAPTEVHSQSPSRILAVHMESQLTIILEALDTPLSGSTLDVFQQETKDFIQYINDDVQDPLPDNAVLEIERVLVVSQEVVALRRDSSDQALKVRFTVRGIYHGSSVPSDFNYGVRVGYGFTNHYLEYVNRLSSMDPFFVPLIEAASSEQLQEGPSKARLSSAGYSALVSCSVVAVGLAVLASVYAIRNHTRVQEEAEQRRRRLDSTAAVGGKFFGDLAAASSDETTAAYDPSKSHSVDFSSRNDTNLDGIGDDDDDSLALTVQPTPVRTSSNNGRSILSTFDATSVALSGSMEDVNDFTPFSPNTMENGSGTVSDNFGSNFGSNDEDDAMHERYATFGQDKEDALEEVDLNEDASPQEAPETPQVRRSFKEKRATRNSNKSRYPPTSSLLSSDSEEEEQAETVAEQEDEQRDPVPSSTTASESPLVKLLKESNANRDDPPDEVGSVGTKSLDPDARQATSAALRSKYSRPTPSYNRPTPSYSRPTPNYQRSTPNRSLFDANDADKETDSDAGAGAFQDFPGMRRNKARFPRDPSTINGGGISDNESHYAGGAPSEYFDHGEELLLTMSSGGTLGAKGIATSDYDDSDSYERTKNHFTLGARPLSPNGDRKQATGRESGVSSKDSRTYETGSTYESAAPTRRAGLYDVFAPSGPIGIVVDTSSEGPTVHSLKSTSPMLGLINPGDLIVGLDDEDTRGMTAATLTRLMAKKAHQKERKITLLTMSDY